MTKRYKSVWDAIYEDDPDKIERMKLFTQCLMKCEDHISQRKSPVICEEFDWDIVIDVIVELKSQGYKVNTSCDYLLMIHIDYGDE